MKNPHKYCKGNINIAGKTLLLFLGVLMFLSACGTVTHSKISGNLKNLSRNQTVAILPIEVSDPDQKEAATIFHRSLYANLVQGKFNVQERYVVDSLLQQAGLTDPSQYRKLSISRLGEILGADAIVFGKVDKVERAYMVIHSSINVGVSAVMVDTRTGETLWVAEDNASDFSGLAKIPTGMLAAFSAPIYFITNKINLRKMTSDMTAKLTSLVKKPGGDNAVKKLALTAKNNNPQNPDKPAIVAVSTKNAVSGDMVALASAPATTKKIKVVPAIAHSTVAQKDTHPYLYTLQVGAYQTKTLAENMIRNLASKGYHTFMTLLENGNSTLYKVQVERFQDMDRAMMFSKELENREHLHAIMIKIYTN
jgi:hypothetical protein